MSFVAWTVLVAACLAKPVDPLPAPVTVSVHAVAATREGRSEKYFDRGLESIRKAVAELEFDTYRLVKKHTVKAPLKKETAFVLNERYKFCITPLSKEADGRIRAKVRIELLSPDRKKKPVNALVATCNIVQKSALKLRLKQREGELIIVVSVSD